MRGPLLLLLALTLPTAAVGDQSDPRLETLFDELVETGDPARAQALDGEIWRIWLESGDLRVDDLMRSGLEAMSADRIDDAIDLFGRIVQIAPGFAEGWNKRATAYYLNNDLAASVVDIQRTLALEPRHFGAISGMGLILLERGDARGALQAFEDVIEINPHAAGARLRVEALREHLRLRGT